MQRSETVPTWAPRVPQRTIYRLYETDAKGLYDEELLDEVGYGLLARCQSFIEANEAVAGRAPCPRCGLAVSHGKGKEEVLRCVCGWELTWREYFQTIQHRQLSGAEPVMEPFRAFIADFPAARTPQAKMLLIDGLLHRFHWYLKAGNSAATPTRPVAVNLIEGRLGEVVLFLDALTYGDQSTPGTRESYVQWDEKIEVNRDWYPERARGEREADDST